VAERKGVDALTKSLFVVGFEGENIHFITRKPIRAVPLGATHTAITVDGLDFLRPRQWVASQHTSLQALVVKHKAKRSLMAKIKPLDSLAALEKQVDLLSELLIALAAGMAPTQRPAWLDDFAAGVKRHRQTSSSETQPPWPRSSLIKIRCERYKQRIWRNAARRSDG